MRVSACRCPSLAPPTHDMSQVSRISQVLQVLQVQVSTIAQGDSQVQHVRLSGKPMIAKGIAVAPVENRKAIFGGLVSHTTPIPGLFGHSTLKIRGQHSLSQTLILHFVDQGFCRVVDLPFLV